MKALEQKLDRRRGDGSLRKLRQSKNLVDFCSNDYLGLARSQIFLDLIKNREESLGNSVGSTGSRLLSGNSELAENLERKIASFHKTEAALIFNSGYDANLGFFSCVPQRGDTIIYDELVHASIRDGVRLGFAHNFSFAHNDLEDLKRKLRLAKGDIFVAVESIYSMEGDVSPLIEIAGICKEYGALLVVDEAHATGVFGKKGEGLIGDLGLESSTFARIHTFGKALGCHGAAVLGSNLLREYLINFSRPLIYTTALPPQSLLAIDCAYELLPSLRKEREQLAKLINSWADHDIGSANPSPIQHVILPGNQNARRVADAIHDSGYDARPILSPTVSEGTERLRINLHAFNTESEINRIVEVIRESIA